MLAFAVENTQEELFGEQANVKTHGTIFGGYLPTQRVIAIAAAPHRDEIALERTLRHEFVGHFGLNTFNAFEKRAVLQAVIDGRNEPGMRGAWERIERAYPNNTTMRNAEEVFASVCETIEPSTRVNDYRGHAVFMETCLEKSRSMTATDLGSLAGWVATGLKDKTRQQRTFPLTNDDQFRKEAKSKTNHTRTRSAAMDKKPFHETVAEKLIAQLESGTAPWQRPWKPGAVNHVLPYNASTGNRYKGINSIVLMMAGREDQRWLTFNQAKAQEAQVRKGEKGTVIQYWKFNDEKAVLDENGKPKKNAQGETIKLNVKLERPRMFTAVVFNAEQIDGLPARETIVPKVPDWIPSERAEAILAKSGASIRHGSDGAFYRPSTDSIHMPDRDRFPSADGYYATALHELGHWTGHGSRLDRDLSHPFGSQGYAKEELRAEIASMILGDEIGIGHDPGQHASYVKSWIAALKEDPMEIFRASADAEKIQQFVLALEQQQEQQQSQEQGQQAEEVAVPEQTQNQQQNNVGVPMQGTLTDRLTQAQEQLQQSVRTLDGKPDPAQEAAFVALAEFAINVRSVTAGGSDAVAKAINQMPEEHQRQALGVARELATANAGWTAVTAGKFDDIRVAETLAANPFQNEQLQAAYASETRFLGQQSARAQAQHNNGERAAQAEPLSALDALHEQMAEADANYQQELERAYGADKAGDARYLDTHDDAAVQTARNAFQDASATWQEGLQGMRRQSLAEAPPEPQRPVAEEPASTLTAEQRQTHAQLDEAMPAYMALLEANREAEQRYYAAELALVDAGTSDASPEHKAELIDSRKEAMAQARTDALTAGDALNDYMLATPVVAAFHVIQQHISLHGGPASFLEADEAEMLARDASLDSDMILAGVTPEQRETTERWMVEYSDRQAQLIPQSYNELRELLVVRDELRDVRDLVNHQTGPKETAEKDLQDFMDNPTEDAELANRFHHLTGLESKLDEVLETNLGLDHPALIAGHAGELVMAYQELADAAEAETMSAAFFPVLAKAEARLHEPAIESVFKDVGAALNSAGEQQALTDKQPAETTPARDTRQRAHAGPQQGWLAVPFAEKEDAKKLGAAWDDKARCWFARTGADVTKLAKWLPKDTQQLDRPVAARDEFRQAMKDLQLETNHKGVEHPIADGKRHRVPVEKVKNGRQVANLDGFYIFHETGKRPAGYISNNFTGDGGKWVATGQHLSDSERAQLAAETAATLQKREREQLQVMDKTAERVTGQMRDLTPVAAGEQTPYLRAKGITAAAGVYTDKERTTTYVPVNDVDGKQWSMQYIRADGTKRFAKDGRKEGCFHIVGGAEALEKAPAIVIGEGYATARTVGVALGYATVAAFDSGNLPEVAKALAKAYPGKPIVITGDDDKAQQIQRGKNPGREKAIEAASEIGGTAVFPIFAPGEQSESPERFSDFNDLASRSTLGADAVRRQVMPAVQDAIEKHALARAASVGQQQDQEQAAEQPKAKQAAKRGMKA